MAWGGRGRFSLPITIFNWPEVTLKVLAKFELVEFLPNLGCLPPFFLKSSFGLGEGEIFTPNHNLYSACVNNVDHKSLNNEFMGRPNRIYDFYLYASLILVPNDDFSEKELKITEKSTNPWVGSRLCKAKPRLSIF